jgi:DNA-binding MarR family transcriptional regulator/GNAT superfamily N-acetyltransferase
MTTKSKQMQQQADAVREFNRYYTVHLGLLRGRYLDTDLSLSEGRILYELALNPSSTANELRHKLGLDAGYMSRLVRSLTERELLQGQRSEQDKRSTLLQLSAAGQAAMADLNQRASAQTIELLEQLEPATRQELLDALTKVRRILSSPAPAHATQLRRAGAAHLDHATRLLMEYFDVIGVVVRDDEAAIRAFLNDASSAMWIAYVDGQPAGCVAMRPLPGIAGAAECKRLYVGDAYRRRGLAEMLMQALETHAATVGHTAVYLDTKDDLHAAITLYQQLGYQNCPRYNDNPQATIFMRKPLR